ncbi:pullulanase-type alpha-1,6-glucosidase [Marinimicrobium locisalis]|uniref:pullulanase-type alpha-1,6-glucosidase n=1 Tax=Marinimicrobium locisalis TaxID=546022 RepID=UPI0032220D67
MNPRDHHTAPRWVAAGALAISALAPASSWAAHTSAPAAVSIPGNLQNALGCSANWAPECAESQLTRGSDGLWRGTFGLPAGEYEYKVALNNRWDENYGAGAEPSGSNITLNLDNDADVRFYYSPSSHWVADSRNHVIAAAVGNFQTALGCPVNWAPDCMRAWLQDPDNTGIYQYTTTDIPAGHYEAKIALNETWDESYGLDGGNIPFTVERNGDAVTFTYNRLDNSVHIDTKVAAGDLSQSKAYWLNEHTIAFAADSQATVKLHYSAEANLTTRSEGVTGGESITLSHDANGMSETLTEQFPHLADYPIFTLAEADREQVRAILKGQVAVSASNEDGVLIEATGVQLPGVLDDLYTYQGQLGPVYTEGVPGLQLWAPTAQNVTFLLYENSHPDTAPSELPMTFDAQTGLWSIRGEAGWDRLYYQFKVQVYVPQTGAVETHRVTDPYTLSASTDGKRSQLVNLDDDSLKPTGWDSLSKPSFTSPEDMVVYELHVRDFSISDHEVPKAYRGKFKAFTAKESLGMTHLKSLREVGLSHVHLLPVNDCATIPEDPDSQAALEQDLSQYAPDSTEQQAAISAIRDRDAFNWCYDPHHFNVPEGSYASDPDGATRIIEFREMVQALNEAGLRVVVDVVYNHTSQAGLGEKSVLDKVVPGYYHRLNGNGDIERSTCCENTASEHAMMEKFMADSLMIWAKHYKVDSFRFDLMGHHSKANILNIKEQLATLSEEEHGVNGGEIYLYGEGWNFGEVANDARFEQATQLNMAGTGVGTFNDRFRDAVRGGSPFDTGVNHVRNQSFINGLYYDPNAENEGSADELERLLSSTDRIRIGLAGSLKNYAFTDWQGKAATGDYGAAVGYTLDPQESINYIEKHDNETLFDINQYKIPLNRTPEDRVRVHNLGASLVLLAQGVPFIQAGQELMRSKSMDRDSYDSGDWYNLLDFSYQQNGWGRGLPPAHSTEANWEVIQPRLADETLAIGESHIRRSLSHFKEMLAIRHSSKLFRLETETEVMSALSFENTGTGQRPALIAMKLTDSEADWDPKRDMLMVLFNAHTEAQTLAKGEWEGLAFELHPIQQDSADERLQEARFDADTGTFTVPARTTAVFQVSQTSAEGGEGSGGENEEENAGNLDEDEGSANGHQGGEHPEQSDSGGGSAGLLFLFAMLMVSLGRKY